MNSRFPVFWLGQVDYESAVAIQESWREKVLAGEKPSALFLLEHPPVITLGAGYHPANLILSAEVYEERGISVVKTDRGGDVTYHCPGQLVAYPIFDLQAIKPDLHWYIRQLEQAFIVACHLLGVEAHTDTTHTGIWSGKAIIGSIGVKVRRWVTTHGVALNCNNDLAGFQTIHPCGLIGQAMTSLTTQLEQDISPRRAADSVIKGFEQAYSIQLEPQEWAKS